MDKMLDMEEVDLSIQQSGFLDVKHGSSLVVESDMSPSERYRHRGNLISRDSITSNSYSESSFSELCKFAECPSAALSQRSSLCETYSIHSESSHSNIGNRNASLGRELNDSIEKKGMIVALQEKSAEFAHAFKYFIRDKLGSMSSKMDNCFDIGYFLDSLFQQDLDNLTDIICIVNARRHAFWALIQIGEVEEQLQRQFGGLSQCNGNRLDLNEEILEKIDYLCDIKSDLELYIEKASWRLNCLLGDGDQIAHLEDIDCEIYDKDDQFDNNEKFTLFSGVGINDGDYYRSLLNQDMENDVSNGENCDPDTIQTPFMSLSSGHRLPINCVDLSIRQDAAVTASDDCTIRLWDMGRTQCIKELSGHTAPIKSVKYTQSLAVSAGADRKIFLWKLKSPNECCMADLARKEEPMICQLTGHTKIVNQLALKNDMLYSCSSDDSVRIWDLNTEKCTSILYVNQPQNSILNYGVPTSLRKVGLAAIVDANNSSSYECSGIVSIDVYGNELLSGSSDGDLRVWDTRINSRNSRADFVIRDSKPCASWQAQNSNSISKVLRNDNFIISGDETGSVKFWDVRNRKMILELKLGNLIYDIQADSDKAYIASNSSDIQVNF